MEIGLVVIALLVAVAIIVIRQQMKAQRQAALAALAAELGLSYDPGDPFDACGLPFDLFGSGDGRGVEDTLYGEIDGTPARLFQFWYYDQHRDTQGHPHRDFHRYTCALVALPGAAPHLCITREGLLSRIADSIGFRDIEFESEEFNRAYNVRADDPRFASAVIDPRMMAWLLDHDVRFRIELSHDALFVAFDQLDPPEWPIVLRAAQRFAAQVPQVAWELYPRTGASVW